MLLKSRQFYHPLWLAMGEGSGPDATGFATSALKEYPEALCRGWHNLSVIGCLPTVQLPVTLLLSRVDRALLAFYG